MRKGFLFFLLTFFPAHVWAGTLEGKIILHTQNSASPMANHPIYLRIFSRSKQTEIASSEESTNAKGAYIFRDLSTSQDHIYLVKTTYDGVSYLEGPVQFLPGTSKISVKPVEMKPATGSLGNLHTQETISLAFGKNDLIKVSHELTIQNSSELIYSPMKEGAEKFNLTLPASAFSFQFNDEDSQNMFEADQKTGLTLTQAIPHTTDGPLKVGFTYLMSYKTSRMPFTLKSTVPLASVTVKLVDGPAVKLESKDLKPISNSTDTFTVASLTTDQPLQFVLKNLPLKNALYRNILFGGLVLVIFAMGYFIWMPHQKPSANVIYQDIIRRLRKLEEMNKNKQIDQEYFTAEEQRLRDMAYTLLQKRT